MSTLPPGRPLAWSAQTFLRKFSTLLLRLRDAFLRPKRYRRSRVRFEAREMRQQLEAWLRAKEDFKKHLEEPDPWRSQLPRREVLLFDPRAHAGSDERGSLRPGSSGPTTLPPLPTRPGNDK